MKKIIYSLVALIFATIFSISCEKAINKVDEAQTNEQESIVEEPAAARVFTLKIADPVTSVSINGSTGKTSWEPNDKIFIHGEYVGTYSAKKYSTIATLTAEDIDDLDPSIATIKLTEDVTPYSNRYLTTLWAAYPAEAVENFSDGDHWYYWNRFKNTNVPLMTGFNNLNVNDGNTFKFYNLCGVISFIVDGDFDSYIFEGNNSETVGYSGYQCRVHVYDDYNSSKTSNFKEQNVWNDTENSYPKGAMTSLEVTGWDGADGSKVNYISIPNGATFSKGFKIWFLKNGVITHYVTSSKSLSLARNDLLPLGDITGKLKTYVDPRHIVTIQPSDYSSTAATSTPGNKMTIDGFDFYSVNARKKSSGTDVVLAHDVSVSIYNDTSLGTITKLVINKGATTTMYNSFTVYAGTTANPSSTVISGSTTPYGGGSGYEKITYDFTGGTYSHFAITYSSQYEGYCGDIEITYISE